MLRTYLFTLAAFDTVGSLASRSGVYDIVVIVGVVELYLYDLNVGIFGKYLLKHLSAVMEIYTDMANLSFCLERKSCLIRVASLEVGIVSRSLCVHEVEVEIVNSAGFKLFSKRGRMSASVLKKFAVSLFVKI